MINKVSQTTKDAIKRKSAYALPDRPSDQGMKPDEIKRAFWQPIVDVTNSTIAELDRVIDELNRYIENTSDAHFSDKNNPHGVTKEQVGLGNVNNTADADKPVSTAQRKLFDDITTKLNSTTSKADASIKNIALDSSTGILTMTRTDGTKFIIDLPLEYMIESGSYNAATKNIELNLHNGQKITVPAAALVNEYYGDDTTITLYTDSGGKLRFKVSDTFKSEVNSKIAKGVEDMTNEVARLEGLISQSGTIVYVDGNPVAEFDMDDISVVALAMEAEGYSPGGAIDKRFRNIEKILDGEVTAAYALFSEEAKSAESYTEGGAIAQKFKKIEKRLTALGG